MQVVHFLGIVAVTCFSILCTVDSTPTPKQSLRRRYMDGYDGCSDEQQKKLGQDLADAVDIADRAAGNIDQSNTA